MMLLDIKKSTTDLAAALKRCLRLRCKKDVVPKCIGNCGQKSISEKCPSLSFLFAICLTKWVLAKDEGPLEMVQILKAIRDGQKASLGPNMGLSPRWHLCFALVIFVIYLFRTMSPHQQSLGRAASAYITVASFFLGALCYGMAGYVGMWVSLRANVRNKDCLWDFTVSHSHQHGCYYETC